MTLLNIAFYILQERLRSHPFLMSRNFETQVAICQWYKVERIETILEDKGNTGRGFGTPLYYLK